MCSWRRLSGSGAWQVGCHARRAAGVPCTLPAATTSPTRWPPAACALAAGAPLDAIARGLERFAPVKGRSRALACARCGACITVVDDTYNANPDSVRAAIDVLAALPGPRLLVLGDMGEVGDQGPQFHAEVGAMRARRASSTLLRWASCRPRRQAFGRAAF
jgi:UDP-N-acetylmuramoyl-tripeptide--D-alanyl-D-alanine ligase